MIEGREETAGDGDANIGRTTVGEQEGDADRVETIEHGVVGARIGVAVE